VLAAARPLLRFFKITVIEGLMHNHYWWQH